MKRERKTKTNELKKIRWYKMLWRNDDKKRVLGEIDLEIEDVEEWWRCNALVIRRHGKQILGEKSEIEWEGKERWWWEENTKAVVKGKKEAKKTFEDSQMEEDRGRLNEKRGLLNLRQGHIMRFMIISKLKKV